jgi:hypothetical protein
MVATFPEGTSIPGKAFTTAKGLSALILHLTLPFPKAGQTIECSLCHAASSSKHFRKRKCGLLVPIVPPPSSQRFRARALTPAPGEVKATGIDRLCTMLK